MTADINGDKIKEAIYHYGSASRSILTNRFFNRGTAFTREERAALKIEGLLPPAVETLQEQVERTWEQLCHYDLPIDRYNHMVSIHGINTTLYYAVIRAHIAELLPIIYTPTVGEACEHYSRYYIRERGVFLSKFLRGKFAQALRNSVREEVQIIVITDGSRILGLGDLGANGVGISMGKISLYVAAGGFHPLWVLPVVLDAGTNTEKYLNDKEYLGVREKRCNDETFYEMMDEFMQAASTNWPGAVIQFEDFSNNHCFDMLERYQSKYRCFNDDIQGTGAVISAGFLNAVKLSGLEPLQHRIVIFGAGSAAVGVARNIAQLASRLYNVPVEDMLKTFYLVDTKGLVTASRGDVLAKHKVLLARNDIPQADNSTLTDLAEVVRYVKPTALIGLGGVGPVFTEEIIKVVAQYTPHPIIFPLSNPTRKSEVTPENAYKWTNGTAIIASGSPFPATTINGKTYTPSQGNNLYAFPGIGLGCALAQPKTIPDDLLVVAAASLNKMTGENELQAGNLYPPLKDIHTISANIATDVIMEAQRLKIATNLSLPHSRNDILNAVMKMQWIPHYEDIPKHHYYEQEEELMEKEQSNNSS